MAQFVEFLNASAAAVLRGRLLAIHCRGGKGRTGSMCCAWLLYTKECEDADDALAFFALERTDLARGKKKLQGVDTPSQRRYVHQLAALLQSQRAYFLSSGTTTHPSSAAACDLRPERASSGGTRSAEASSAVAMGGGCTDSSIAASTTSSAAAAASAAATADSEGGARVPAIVQLPATPVLSLSRLELRSWFALPPKGGSIVCAVHTELPSRCGPCFVTHWSAPLFVPPGHVPPDRLAFSFLGDVRVAGDVRISVFSLLRLHDERLDRVKHGEAPTLPFDRAAEGPWGVGGLRAPAAHSEHIAGSSATGHLPPPRGPPNDLQRRRDARRQIAGEEPGCLFYFIFHTGFVGAADEIRVPMRQMDRAWKNKKGEYQWEGEAALRFTVVAELGDGGRGSNDNVGGRSALVAVGPVVAPAAGAAAAQVVQQQVAQAAGSIPAATLSPTEPEVQRA